QKIAEVDLEQTVKTLSKFWDEIRSDSERFLSPRHSLNPTVIRWHREWLRRRWHDVPAATDAGRPPLDPKLRQLIIEMATANSLWGARRIHGELRKIGMQVSERTVSRWLARLSRPPSQTWRTFLANHVAAFASMDFFSVSTLTGRLLFVF